MVRIPESLTVVGAYAALAPGDRTNPRTNDRFLRAVLALPGCGGLEVPWTSTTFIPDADVMLCTLAESGEHMLTLVAGTMERAATGLFGLASLNEEGRHEAVELVRRAQRASGDLAQAAGRRVIAAVEIQSAPHCSVARLTEHEAAFARSLTEITSWDWSGAELLVEHCDSALGIAPTKGFLPLDSEIAAVSALGEAATPVGIAVNWGRSVIEARNPQGALDQLQTALSAGRLRALGVSGASAQATPLGSAWSDSHLPVRTPAAMAAGLDASLLTSERLDAFLRVGSAAPLRSVKIAAPAYSTTRERLAIIEESLGLTLGASRNPAPSKIIEDRHRR